MRNLAASMHEQGRVIVLAMAFAAVGFGLAAVAAASLLHLDACHMCIFQRLAYFVIGILLFVAFLSWGNPLLRRAWLAAASAFCAWGLTVSAQQSWLQWFPDSAFTCSIGETGLAEQLIDWLGHLYPLFFMATGFCGSKDLVVAGLSLANLSFLILLAFLAGCAGLLFRT